MIPAMHDFRPTLKAFLRAQVRAAVAAAKDDRDRELEDEAPALAKVDERELRTYSLDGMLEFVLTHWDALNLPAPDEARGYLEQFASVPERERMASAPALQAAERYATLSGSATTANAVKKALEARGLVPDGVEEAEEEEEWDDRPVPIPDSLEVGTAYSRDEIHDLLGGSKIKFLPHVGGRVVAGAFKLESNPCAPEAVLVPDKKSVAKWAKVVARQRAPIPVFIGVDNKEWVYKGPYRCAGMSGTAEDIVRAGGVPENPQHSSVLFFQPDSDSTR